jgi:hypothetical protein
MFQLLTAIISMEAHSSADQLLVANELKLHGWGWQVIG